MIRTAVACKRIASLLAALALSALLASCAAPQTSGARPDNCRTGCVTPYGQVLGVALGNVPAYSNCNARCVVFAPNRSHDTYTGIRWQCVEFARRWLLENRGAVFGDVKTASDIWGKISSVTRVADGKRFALESYLNGAFRPLQVGDLLIYSKEYLNTGHVAVVTAVDLKAGIIEVAEQNFRNQLWPGHYARRIAGGKGKALLGARPLPAGVEASANKAINRSSRPSRQVAGDPSVVHLPSMENLNSQFQPVVNAYVLGR